jgi:hypothetical protein
VTSVVFAVAPFVASSTDGFVGSEKVEGREEDWYAEEAEVRPGVEVVKRVS